jgi:hypothetical protein
MLKNLFKAAKKALKNPLVQMGIGAFLPGAGFMSKLPAIFSNPAVLQGGIGLLAGDKPENVLRNVGMSALLGGIGGMGKDGPGFVEGAKGTFRTPTRNQALGDTDMFTDRTPVSKEIQQASNVEEMRNAILGAKDVATTKPETFLSRLGESVTTPEFLINAAQLGVPFLAAALDDANEQQLDPTAISGLDLQNYQDKLAQSQYQATGGITGFAAGGYDPTNGMKQVSYGSTMGEPNGLFTGPGGPKEDKIDVKLSPGEFVFTAESAEKIGPDNLYAMMNSVDSDSERPQQYRERVGMA